MESDKKYEQPLNEDEDMLLAMQLSGLSIIPYAIKTAIEMDLFEIIAKAGPPGTHLSPSDLAAELRTKNPDASTMIDRLMRLLVSYSVVTCKYVTDEDGRKFRVYGLGKIGKQFVKDEDGVSLAPFVLLTNSKMIDDVWFHLTESIIEGGATAFERAHGEQIFVVMERDESQRNMFYEAMNNHTKIVMKKILEVYDGFERLNDAVLIDVGGGVGANLGLIVSKYPRIKGINFDLPHVVKDAPHLQGVEHIGGDMFKQIPQAHSIFMKWILHDWSDEKCVEILKNCRKALPERGKVILVESVIPEEVVERDLVTKNSLCFDLGLMGSSVGGKERTRKEFEVLAREAGFDTPRIICRAYSYWIIELYKN